MMLNKIKKIGRLQNIPACLLIAAGCPAFAQTSADPALSPTSQSVARGGSVLYSPGDPIFDATDSSLFQWGPVSLHPRFVYRFSYGDGLQSQPGESEKTAIHEFAPGILFRLGEVWTLDYAPSYTMYSSDSFDDTLGHAVILSGRTQYNDWGLSLSQGYSSSSTPLRETGAQTDQESFSTALGASYHFSDKMWMDLGVNQNLTFTDDFNDSREWSTLDWLNYQFVPGCYAGIGVGFGYVDVQTGFDMTYQQLKAQLGWRVSEKISLNLNAGAESRQFLDSDADTLINPIFGAAIDYQLFEPTRISLSASRSVNASYFENQVTETTGFGISVNQRLLEKLNLNVAYGYYTSDYISSETGSSLDREDDGSSVSVSLGFAVRPRLSIAAFYHWSDNSSGESEFDYSSTQVGFEVSYRY